MKLRKVVYKLLLCMGIILSVIHPIKTASAKGNEDFVIEDGILRKYVGNEKIVEIPSGIKKIGTLAFEEHKEIEKVIMPDGLVEIGSMAFAGCSNLEEIIIPKSVKIMYSEMFYGTKWLENQRKISPFIIINEILVNAETAVGDVIIPETVTKIGSNAFGYNKEVTSVKIPENVTSIDGEAFIYCTQLKKVTMTNSVTELGADAFSKCKALVDVRLSSSVDTIYGGTFEGCKSLKYITLPSKLTSMGDCVFRGCKKLRAISVPDGLNKISVYVFENCHEDLTVYANDNTYMKEVAETEGIAYEKIKLSTTKLSLKVGKKQKLTLNCNGRCTWSSSNKKVVKVSSTGEITALKKGTATITAKIYGKKYTCKVTVK